MADKYSENLSKRCSNTLSAERKVAIVTAWSESSLDTARMRKLTCSRIKPRMSVAAVHLVTKLNGTKTLSSSNTTEESTRTCPKLLSTSLITLRDSFTPLISMEHTAAACKATKA